VTAIDDLKAAFDCAWNSAFKKNCTDWSLGILKAEFELSRISTTACLTVRVPVHNNATYLSYSFQLIWQYGDRHYHAKKWTEAADWFRAGSHQVFKNMGSSNVSKCLRKAALCHVQQREYAKASSDIRLCANSEATTHYMTLLIAIHQGQVFSNHSNVI